MLAAILGAGPVADAFFVALRLPNHFRAIFAEGPSTPPSCRPMRISMVRAKRRQNYSPIASSRCCHRAGRAARGGVAVHAAGDRNSRAGIFARSHPWRAAIALTRITFPYLLLVTLVTLYGGMLNVMHRFASAAAAPIFLNLSMMATLALAVLFPGAGYAAAWGVLIAGVLEFLLLAGDAWRSGILPRFAPAQARCGCPRVLSRPRSRDDRLDGHPGRAVRRTPSSRRFCPPARCRRCTTPTVSTSWPIGVIGIAIGTVLLPEMSRRLASAITPARASRSGRRSILRCCFRCHLWPRSSRFPTSSCARCSHAAHFRRPTRRPPARR